LVNGEEFLFKLGYPYGEYQANFDNVSVTFTNPDGSSWSGLVAGDAATIWVWVQTGQYKGLIIKGIWQIGYGVETKDFTWAMGEPGKDPPADFNTAMTSPGQTEFFFVSCLKDQVCKFDH